MFARKSIHRQNMLPTPSPDEKAKAGKAKQERTIKALVRTLGSFSDVSITTEHVVRNEMTEDGLMYPRRMKIPTTIAIFHPSVYDLVTNLLQMPMEKRQAFLRTKSFAILITEQDFKAGPNDPSVLTQLKRMTPFIHEIRNLSINIDVPVNYTRDNEQFESTPSHTLLCNIVEELQQARALKKMSVVLVLPKNITRATHPEKYPLVYLYPFFPLHYENWHIRFKASDPKLKIMDASRQFEDMVDRKYKELSRMSSSSV